jgi:hypothetical protein
MKGPGSCWDLLVKGIEIHQVEREAGGSADVMSLLGAGGANVPGVFIPPSLVVVHRNPRVSGRKNLVD